MMLCQESHPNNVSYRRSARQAVQRSMLALPQQQWQDGLLWLHQTYKTWLAQTDLELVYSREPGNARDHGCPPPLPALGGDDHRTTILLDENRYLWCTPANYAKGVLDTEIPRHSIIEVTSLGTLLWLVGYTFLHLRQQGHLSAEMVDIQHLRQFKYKAARDLHTGFAQAAFELGWASHTYTDPQEIQCGDLLGICHANGRIAHWCIAWKDPYITHQGKPAIQTLGASPIIEGVGLTPYLLDKPGRSWIGAAMFRE